MSGAPSTNSEPSVSIVVPVKDGGELLKRLVAKVADSYPFAEFLLIDSGSSDGSAEFLARQQELGSCKLLTIPADQFKHGPVRNLGVSQTSGEIICFLTQDAEPIDGWLEAIVNEFAGTQTKLAAVFGPHLPRPDTSPMIARELSEFFEQFPSGIQNPDLWEQRNPGSKWVPFLSNVNTAYSRRCLTEIGFRDIAYAEDQAIAADLNAAGWALSFQPEAAVLHAHDYGPIAFAKRYFDEYRGLRESRGHIEPFRPKAALGAVVRLGKADQEWMKAQGYSAVQRARWMVRSTVHHGSRRVFSALGSRSQSLPKWLSSRLSLEKR